MTVSFQNQSPDNSKYTLILFIAICIVALTHKHKPLSLIIINTLSLTSPLPPQESSHCLWPGEVGDSEDHGKLKVKLLSVKTHGDIVIRRLEVVEGSSRLNKALLVTLLQLTSWLRHGLPHPTAVLSLADHLTNAQMRSATIRTVNDSSCAGLNPGSKK